MNEIVRLQENLLLIRRSVGWSAEEFGDKIGVTRQTINNIESGRNKLTKTQYIAMRSILDAEIIQFPDDTVMLAALLDVLVDNPEKYSSKEREELISKANLMAPAILAGTATRKDVSKEWLFAVGAIIGAGTLWGPIGVGITAASVWLSKTLSSKDKKSKKP